MESSDDVDFHSKFTVYNDDDKEIATVGLSEKQMLILIIVFLGIVFLGLLAFGAVETKQIESLKGLITAAIKEIKK